MNSLGEKAFDRIDRKFVYWKFLKVDKDAKIFDLDIQTKEIGVFDRVQVSYIFSKTFSILHIISIMQGRKEEVAGEEMKSEVKSFYLPKRKKLGANDHE